MPIEYHSITALISGRTRSGKTQTFLKCAKKAKYDLVMVFTTTPEEYLGLKNRWLLDFRDIDKIKYLFHPKIKELKKCVVIDNFIGVYKLDKQIEMLYTQCRHYNISTWTLTQYMAKVPSVCRENSLYIFALSSNVRSYELMFNLQNKFSKKGEFIEFMQKHACRKPIIIDNYNVELRDNIFITT